MRAARGLVIAAPQSGSGKTVVTLGLLRALSRTVSALASAKSGPDYIDPRFHEAATDRTCLNLDAWAMPAHAIRTLVSEHVPDDGLLVVEGAMGLFDGAANGRGSTADLAAILDIPVILVIDAAKQSQSVAALVHGFRSFRSDVLIGGVILNRVGSDRHERLLRAALEPLDVPVLGAIPRDDHLALPERHLGLVQAEENDDLQRFIDKAADRIMAAVDLKRLQDVGRPLVAGSGPIARLPALGRRTAVARDRAFAFIYPHLIADWERQGTEVSFFSPLADQSPDERADSVFLPGGYPELHGARLAGAERFRSGMVVAAAKKTTIYGECGGYMVLGDALVDSTGLTHKMLGLLPLTTSFEKRRRQLGYRRLTCLNASPFSGPLHAHEFHYSTIASEGIADRVFEASDAEGNTLGPMGLRRDTVFGSYAHLIGMGEGGRPPI